MYLRNCFAFKDVHCPFRLHVHLIHEESIFLLRKRRLAPEIQNKMASLDKKYIQNLIVSEQ